MRVKDHADYYYQYQGYQNAPDQNRQAANPGPRDRCGQNQKTGSHNGQTNFAGHSMKTVGTAQADSAGQGRETGGAAQSDYAGQSRETGGAALTDSVRQSQRAEISGQTDSAKQKQKRMAQQTSPVKRAFERRSSSSLYSSTRDLMAIANTEDQEILRGIYVRLSFKLWSVRAAGATGTDTTAIKSATRSIQKVMGKVKSKIKGLQKELELEKKAEIARKAKQRRLQQELRRELAIKRKIRREKERRDVAESYLESDSQFSVKGYQDNLPLEVLLEMEMQRSGSAGTADATLAETAVGMAVTEAGAAVPVDVSMTVGGDIVDVAL